MDVAGRADRLRAALRRRRVRRPPRHQLINIRYLTGFTGSAGAPARAARRARVRHRRPLPRAGRRRSSPRPGSTPASRSSGTEQQQIVLGGRRRRRPARPRGRRRHLGRAAPLRRRLVPRGRAGAHRGPGRGPAPGEGRRRGGPDRGGRGTSPTRRWPRIRPRLAEGPTEEEFGLELDTEIRRLGAVGHQLRDDRGGRARTAPSPTTGPARGRSPRATWSCSTSAPWSTATART